MFEAYEGEFAYTIQHRRSMAGDSSWHWRISHRLTGVTSETGISHRSHDAAKTAALDAIFLLSTIRLRGGAAS